MTALTDNVKAIHRNVEENDVEKNAKNLKTTEDLATILRDISEIKILLLQITQSLERDASHVITC